MPSAIYEPVKCDLHRHGALRHAHPHTARTRITPTTTTSTSTTIMASTRTVTLAALGAVLDVPGLDPRGEQLGA
jgi:hypothetical protein